MARSQFDRSPLFYVGDKYKLLPQMTEHYPVEFNRFIEVFAGGGSVFLNVNCNTIYINDIDKHLIEIHKYLMSYGNNHPKLLERMRCLIEKYGLTDSSMAISIPVELKKQFPKTYLAKMNADGYTRMKTDFNAMKSKDYGLLYLLLIYGFNRMLRFNRTGQFNLPIGNVDFNKNVVNALEHYAIQTSKREIQLSNLDFREFLKRVIPKKDDFFYFDPPYLITGSEYNKLWNEKDEASLYQQIDILNESGIKFMLSNVVDYNGKSNELLKAWATKYEVVEVKSNYINYFNNSQKNIREILVKNYD